MLAVQVIDKSGPGKIHEVILVHKKALNSSKANNDFYLELNIFPRSMLFQGDLPLNTPYKYVSMVVRDCSVAILKGKWCGQRYSALCNIPLRVRFLLSQPFFSRIDKEENLLFKYIVSFEHILLCILPGLGKKRRSFNCELICQKV